eukprot:snap_masked-scaffold_8-processed-gene-11.2-mRNA-1 protein AED:1.00 eAED:1.00 QI:0/-1/0/0/-1/1/1/0/403
MGKGKLKKGTNAITKLFTHISQLLNVDLDPFYEKNVHCFGNNFKPSKSTDFSHEQYEAFLEFQRLIDLSLAKFVQKEGYKDIDQVYELIKSAMIVDKKLHAKFLERLMKRIQQLQGQVQKELVQKTNSEEEKLHENSKHSSHSSEETSTEQKEEKDELNLKPIKQPNPLQCFVYSPSNLENLLDSLLRTTSYETFTRIMQVKTRQIRVGDQILEKKRVSKKFRLKITKVMKKARKDLDQLVEGFRLARDRLCGLVPEGFGYEKDIRPALKEEDFEHALLESDYEKLLSLTTCCFHYLGCFSSYNLYSKISEEYGKIKNRFPSGLIQFMISKERNKEEKNCEFKAPDDCEEIEKLSFDIVESLHEFLNQVDDNLFEQVNIQEEFKQKVMEKAQKWLIEEMEVEK